MRRLIRRWRKIREYFDELHEQHYVMVTGHDKDLTSFRHTKLVEIERIDSDGNKKRSWETEVDHEWGYKFYYILTTVAPGRSTSERVYVGEKEGIIFNSWNYRRDEQVGFAREWKRLHDDDKNIRTGLITPRIEPLLADCAIRN